MLPTTLYRPSCRRAFLALLAAAITAFSAGASTFSVSVSGSSFTITRSDEGDTVLGNGFIGLQAATDLTAFAAAGEVRPIPVSATVDAATGRAVLDIDFGLYLQALNAPPGFTPPPPPTLFTRPVLTPIYPDINDFSILQEGSSAQ